MITRKREYSVEQFLEQCDAYDERMLTHSGGTSGVGRRKSHISNSSPGVIGSFSYYSAQTGRGKSRRTKDS